MIGQLRGTVIERALDGTIVVDVGGVGYEVLVPLSAYGRLPAPPETATIYVHTHMREDALQLFGFLHPNDRAAFRILMTVSSVGPKLAMSILSHLDAATLAQAIAREDRKALSGISGVGKKIVERLVLELKDKLGGFHVASDASMPIPTIPVSRRELGPLGQLTGILVSMGFRPLEAERAIAAIAPGADGKTQEQLLREALASMS